MSERRSNTIRAVVERPDHHCGDDLVGCVRAVQLEKFAILLRKLGSSGAIVVSIR